MKKTPKWAALLIGASVTLQLTACGAAQQPAAQNSVPTDDAKPLRVLCTVFPVYDWTQQLVGEQTDAVEVSSLVDSGIDLHSYQPTAQDIIKIADSDLLIYVGGESDAWITDALQTASNPDLQVLNLIEVLGDKAVEEELAEGMEADEDEGDETAYDEHIWLSLKNAETLTGAITDALEQLDPTDAAAFAANEQTYAAELDALDTEYAQTLAACPQQTLVFGDRFPFRYLVEDYGLSYYAAFPGCSAETEAGFDTITFLASKLDELGLKTVLTIEGSDHKIAETVIGNTTAKDQRILTLDSMQAVTAAQIADGATYLSIMQDNLAVLTDALR